MADAISNIREAHYFTRSCFTCDTPNRGIQLPDGETGWIKPSASVRQLWRSALSLLKRLEKTFTPSGGPTQGDAPTRDQRAPIGPDGTRKGMAILRDAAISHLAAYMGWRMDEIDCAAR